MIVKEPISDVIQTAQCVALDIGSLNISHSDRIRKKTLNKAKKLRSSLYYNNHKINFVCVTKIKIFKNIT